MSKNLTATKEAAQYASMQNHATRYYVLTRKGERPIFDSDAEQVRSKLAFSVWYLEGCYINGAWEGHEKAFDEITEFFKLVDPSGDDKLEAAYKLALQSSWNHPNTRYYILTHRIYRPVVLTLEWMVKSRLTHEDWNLKGSYINGQFSSISESWNILLHRSN